MASGGFGSGWGASLGAWHGGNSNKQQQQWNEDEAPIKASAERLSEVDLSSSAPSTAAINTSKTGLAGNSFTAAFSTAGLNQANSLAAREAVLAKKEAALQAKERELQDREAELKRNGGGAKKNWPSRCFPLLHHDIASDIPQHMQGQVKLAYLCYLGLVVCLLYNFVGACAMVGLNAPDRMSSWFLATIYLVTGVPLAMLLWYMKLYNTCANNGTLGYLGFFIAFVIHVAFCTWAAIAVPLAGERWSFTGFVAALRGFDVSKAGGVIYLIGSCLWTIEALASYWCLKTVYFSFRSSGKQQQAHDEMSKIALKHAAHAAMQNKV